MLILFVGLWVLCASILVWTGSLRSVAACFVAVFAASLAVLATAERTIAMLSLRPAPEWLVILFVLTTPACLALIIRMAWLNMPESASPWRQAAVVAEQMRRRRQMRRRVRSQVKHYKIEVGAVMLALFNLTGCTTPADADIARSKADVAIAQEHSRQLQIMAETQNGYVWPIVALAVALVIIVGLFVWLQWRTVQAVERVATLHLLPGDVGFQRALIDAATERGAVARRRGGDYFLVYNDGVVEPVKRLTVRG